MPNAFIWADLGIGGDCFHDYSVNILEELRCDWSDTSFDVYNYLPRDNEIGLFGRIVGGRTIPDLSFRELYAFAKDALVRCR